jgi:hypothetical protein
MTEWDLFMAVPGHTRAILIETQPDVIPEAARDGDLQIFLAPTVDDLLNAVRQVDGADG